MSGKAVATVKRDIVRTFVGRTQMRIIGHLKTGKQPRQAEKGSTPAEPSFTSDFASKILPITL